MGLSATQKALLATESARDQKGTNAAVVATAEDVANVQTRNGAASDPFEKGDIFEVPKKCIENSLLLKRHTRALQPGEEDKDVPYMYYIKVFVYRMVDGQRQDVGVKNFFPSSLTKRVREWHKTDGIASAGTWHSAKGEPCADYLKGSDLGESLAQIEGKTLVVSERTEYLTAPFGKRNPTAGELEKAFLNDYDYVV